MKILDSILIAFAVSRALPNFNVLRVASAVTDGDTVTFGTKVFEVDVNNPAGITAGRVRVDLTGSSAAAAAVGTLTSDNTNVANNDTVVIGGKTYTFKSSLTPTEGEVLIGGSADASLLNLIRAINHTGTPGTDYSCAAANTQVSAASSVTSHAFQVTALVKGTPGNAIATTETSGHLSWGGATLASGADPSAAEFTTALTTAINTTGVLEAVRISANEVLVIDRSNTSFQAKACSETLAGSNNAWAAANSYGGHGTPDTLPAIAMINRAAITQEVTLGNMHFVLGFAPVSVIVQVTSSAGAKKAWDGAVTISGKRVIVDNSGATDWAAGDIVTLLASQ
jgi:hypothetical protein